MPQTFIFPNEETDFEEVITVCNFSKKVIEKIDLSNNQLESVFSFFQCLGSSELYLQRNNIHYIRWNLFDKSLRVLDLRHNMIDKLFVVSVANLN